MPKYKVLYHLKHDGKLYLPGKTIELDEKEAAGLGSIEKIEPPAPAKKK